MVALAVTVLLGVSFRFAGSALVWYDEVAAVQLAWITYYGSAYAALKGSHISCLLYTSPSPRDRQKSRMPSSA